MSPSPPAPAGSALQAALARLLRPLVRLLIRQGLTYPALSAMLCELYVNVAEHDFAIPGKPQTDSRVSLITGINRKEVRRLRGAGAPVNPVPASLSRTSRILARWMADPALAGPDGRPMPLPRVAAGSEPSFETLVASVTRDVRPRAVLDEWIDRSLVDVDTEDRVTLIETAVVPRGSDEQRFYYLGRNLHDHVAAAASNVQTDTPPFLERAVHYDGLSEAAMRSLEAGSRALAMDALRAANRAAHARCETDDGGRWRWTFGVYVYAEEAAAAPPDGDGDGSDATP